MFKEAISLCDFRKSSYSVDIASDQFFSQRAGLELDLRFFLAGNSRLSNAWAAPSRMMIEPFMLLASYIENDQNPIDHVQPVIRFFGHLLDQYLPPDGD